MRTKNVATNMARSWGSAAIIGLLFAGTSLGEDAVKMAEHPIVLRISSDVLNSFVDSKEVERHAAVQDVILGTSVFGTAHVHGTPAVKLTDSPDKARFWITLNGTVNSTTTGYNGPAIIYSRSVTNFTATRLVTFEPGKGFAGAPAQVSASTRTIIDGIGSSRGGLIGRIVRRRATKIEAGQHDQVQEIVRQRVANRVRNAFDKQSDVRLAKMNEALDLRQLAQTSKVPMLGKDMNWFCCTTPRYLQIATQTGKGAPLDLPVNSAANTKSAPIEIWMHDSMIGPRFAAGLEMLKLQAENSNLGLTVATAVKLLSMNSDSDMADKIPTLLAEKPIQLHKVDDWRVAKLEMPPKEIAQVVQVLRPELVNRGVGVKVSTQPPAAAIAQAQRAAAVQRSLLSTEPVVDRPAVAHNAPSDEARTWTSGKYTAEARFLSLDGDTVHLQRPSGVKTNIRFDKLSDADQKWIRQYVSTPPLTARVPPVDTE